MKEIVIAIGIFFILAGIVRYNGYKVEEEVRVFCESIQSEKLSYEEIISTFFERKCHLKNCSFTRLAGAFYFTA